MLRGWSHYAHGAQNPDRHRQIESRAFLAHVSRRQVDSHTLAGISEAGIHQSALDALAALAHGCIRHPHGDEIPVPSWIHIHFDIDDVGVNTIDRRGARTEESHSMMSGGAVCFL